MRLKRPNFFKNTVHLNPKTTLHFTLHLLKESNEEYSKVCVLFPFNAAKADLYQYQIIVLVVSFVCSDIIERDL